MPIPYMFFFCPEKLCFQGFFHYMAITKKQKKGLKKGGQWFRMESSGKEWWIVV